MSSTDGLLTRRYTIGGMAEKDSGNEVVDTMSKIDGVKDVKVDEKSQGLTIMFDSGRVSEDHLISTLTSLGHSILRPDPVAVYEKE